MSLASQRVRRIAGGALPLLLATALLFVTVAPAPSTGAGPFSFPHRPHMSAASIEAGLAEARAAEQGLPRPGGGGEKDQDCRVCHAFGPAGEGAESHLENCKLCHVDADHLLVQVRPTDAGDKPFPHAAHLEDTSVTCFTCHRMRVEDEWIEFSVPDGTLGERGREGRNGGKWGEATCADCHAEHQPGGDLKQDDTTGDGKACSLCHLGATSILPLAAREDGRAPTGDGLRPFRHADHGGAAYDCMLCHVSIPKSQSIWDYDPVEGTAGSCAACHTADAQGTPLVRKGREVELPFVDFDRFPHDAHLAPPKGEIQVSGKVRDGEPRAKCATCHFPELDPGSKLTAFARPDPNEPLGRATLVAYEACLPCHEAWKAKDHGVGAWACFKCHEGQTDAEGKLPIASASVRREHVEKVGFAAQHHPGMTAKGARLGEGASKQGDKTCLDCHVGMLEDLQSRLAGRGFEHAAHVPAEPRNADCLPCHLTSATTSWSQDLRRFDAHLDRKPTPTGAAASARGCLECHAGATREELGLFTRGRKVTQFDHRAHVNAEKPVACTACHESGGDVGYQTPVDVLNCERCHSHDPAQAEKYAHTGPKSSEGEAANCKACHERVYAEGTGAGGTTTVTSGPARRTRKRRHLELAPGTQYHDKGGACAECHDRDPKPGREPAEYRERIKRTKILLSIHEDPKFQDAWFNDPRLKEDPSPDPQGRTCMTCHRFEPRGYLTNLGGGGR